MSSLYPSERDTLEVVTALHAFIERTAILFFVGVVACDTILHLIGDNRLQNFVSWKEHVWSIDLPRFTSRIRLPAYTGRLSFKAILKAVSLLAFGVAIGLEFIALPYSEKIDELTQSERDDSRKQTTRSLIFASGANRDAKTARADTEKLRSENLKLQMDVLRLRERLADRHLSAEQQLTVTGKLRRFSRQRCFVMWYAGNGEASGLANDIMMALSGPDGAGWDTDSAAGEEMDRAISGILVELRDNAVETDRTAATALVSALRAERLEISGPVPAREVLTLMGVHPENNRNPPDPIKITIGRKP